MTDSEWYQELKARGICIECVKADAVRGKVRCVNCLDENNYSSLTYIERMKSNDPERYAELIVTKTDRRREMRKQREHQGLCTLCGKREAKSGRKSCETCLYKAKVRRRANYIKNGRDYTIPRHERPAYGQCYICGEHVKQGKSVCEMCHERMKRNIPEPPTAYHIWRKANRLIGVRNGGM